MGTPRDGDSGPFDELPELPPDVRIPDDAAELAEEAAQVRRELREERVGGSRTGARVFSGGGFRGSVPPDGGQSATEPASLRIPLLIMTAALLAAVISLFAAAWPDERRGLPPPAAASSPGRTAPTELARTLPDVALLDAQGNAVPLGSLLPAVLILADDCPCAAEIAAAAPPGVAVVAVATNRRNAPPSPTAGGSTPIAGGSAPPGSAPTPTLGGSAPAAGRGSAPGDTVRGSTPAAARGSAPSPSTATLPGPAVATVRRLRDPDGVLATALGAPLTPGAAPIALVARSGEITRIVDSAMPISAYEADLAFLPAR